MCTQADIIAVQARLLQWIKHHGRKSFEQIKNTSIALQKTFGLDGVNPLFGIFYPLVRMGLVEFAGNGTYIPSSPVLIYYRSKNRAVCVNLFENQKMILHKIATRFDEDSYGILRANVDRSDVESFSKSSNCLVVEPRIHQFLSQFPTISQAVSQFERAVPSSLHGEYYNLRARKWTRDVQEECLFRISKESQKIYLRVGYDFFEIPDKRINPDSRPVAESYLSIRRFPDCIEYNSQTSTLKFSSFAIPILVERMLRMASLDTVDGVAQTNFTTTFSNISDSTSKQIYRIFGQINHE